MKIKRLIGSVVASLIIPAHAESVLLGEFGHGFSSERDRAVWSIRKKGLSYEVEFMAVQKTEELRYFSGADVLTLWNKLLWPESSRTGAECLGNEEDIFCHVPREERAKVGGLATNASDFFYYNAMAGVMEIHRIKK